MKVFQSPIEIAGQMGLLTEGLKSLGHQVKSYNTWSNYLAYKENIHNVSVAHLRRVFEKRKSNFDVFHFHYGMGFMPHSEEFRHAGRQGKVAVMQYWGSDVRTERKAAANNPYAKLIGEFADEKRIERRLERHSRYLSACIVQDFEVVPYVVEHFRRVYVLPIAIDSQPIEPRYPSGAIEEPVIVHAPTQPYFKGTAYIEETLDRLRKDGFRFQYRKIEGLPHDEAIEQYAQADIIVDQVLCGSYGLFAVEGLAYGKPVVSYIRNDLKRRFPEDLPIISANPATLYDVLRQLLEHPETWEELGRRGRQYVNRYHALPVVAKSLNWIYRREWKLRERANGEGITPCVIQFLGKDIRCYPIHPKTHHVEAEEIAIPTWENSHPHEKQLFPHHKNIIEKEECLLQKSRAHRSRRPTIESRGLHNVRHTTSASSRKVTIRH